MISVNKSTGEITGEKLNQVIVHEYIRKDGSRAVDFDYSNCTTLTEQHTAHLSDLNYLIKKFQPDELAAYIAARSQYRQEILGHDFSTEPSLQEAKNNIYLYKKAYDRLPDEVKANFKNHLEFLKFIDNPANAEKMVKLGLLTKKQLKQLTKPTQNDDDSNDDKTPPLTKQQPLQQQEAPKP